MGDKLRRKYIYLPALSYLIIALNVQASWQSPSKSCKKGSLDSRGEEGIQSRKPRGSPLTVVISPAVSLSNHFDSISMDLVFYRGNEG
jgi:hypothetical protein